MKHFAPLAALLVLSCCWSTTLVAQAPGHGNPHEIDQMPGFPIEIGPHQPGIFSRGAVLADLDGDNDLEVIYVHHTCPFGQPLCGEGQVAAWDHHGNVLPGFPVVIEANEDYPPSVGDLDGDGKQEIVVTTFDSTLDNTLVYIIDHLGVIREGFPLSMGLVHGFTVLHDLDLDGTMEMIFSDIDGLQVINADGTLWDDGWPVDLASVTGDYIAGISGSVSVGDVDLDGQAEIAIESARYSAVLVSANGDIVEGWPQHFETKADIVGSYSLLADIDGDVDLEVILVRFISHTGRVEVHLLQHNGEPMPGWPQAVNSEPGGGVMSVSAPIVADLEGDSEPEIIIAASQGGGYGHGPRIFAWDSSGELKQGFPYHSRPDYNAGAVQIITAVDIDGDGTIELFADTNRSVLEGETDLGFIFGIDFRGRDLQGFPLRPSGVTNPNGAIFGDVDQDGDYEMAVLGMSFREAGGPMLRLHLYDFTSSYSSEPAPWPTYHAANDRSGLHKRRYKDWRFVNAGTRIGGGR